MTQFDELIHQPVRLRIMSALAALQPKARLEFTYLRDLLGVTDGNLGAHLRKLEDAGYVNVHKTFVERKPRTYIGTTDLGRHAFAGHVSALEAVLRGPSGEEGTEP